MIRSARMPIPDANPRRDPAFRVSDLDAVVEQLRSNDVLVEDVRIDDLTGARFTFFADPDGLPLEIYEVVAG